MTDTRPSTTAAPSESSEHDTPDRESAVSMAQRRMAIDRSQASQLTGAAFGLVVCWLLWGHVPAWLLASWLAFKITTSVLRVWTSVRHAVATPADSPRWARRFEWSLAFDGLAWGLVATLLLPQGSEVLRSAMLATVVCVAALGLIGLSSNLRTSLAFVLPVMLPSVLYQFAQGDPISYYTGVGLSVFLGLLILEGSRIARHMRAMLRLRFQMDDVTKKLQCALADARLSSTVKSRFLATMSHEMRTPLHAILGLTRMLQGGVHDMDRFTWQSRLGTLEKTGEHLLGIINDVLDYSRIESGVPMLSPQPFDLRGLLASVDRMARVAAVEKGLALRLDCDIGDPCWVWGDGTRLQQVLVNLNGNAVKFTAQGGVTLAVRRPSDGHTTIDVIDSGPGVPQAEREAVFEAFSQGDGSFGRHHDGTGLGLTISRELARAMGGDLVCLDAPGGGALFRMTVHLPDAQAPQPVAPLAPVRAFRGRVLVVEDNLVNAMVAQDMLEHLRLQTQVVRDGEAAVNAVRQCCFDLVLMDWHMPGIDGFETTARIRDLERALARPPVPIVALTANALAGDRERSLAAGMNEHLAKPFDASTLSAMLARYLPEADEEPAPPDSDTTPCTGRY